MVDNPNRSADLLRFPCPRGTRDRYREIAKLAGLSLNEWCREALRKSALELLEAHEVEMELPPVHPPKPKRLQPRIRVSRRRRRPSEPEAEEDEG